MDNWNKLLGLLDMTLGFPNKIRSDVKKKGQSFDQRTGEHVFVLEYRIKVNSGIQPPPPTVHRDPQPKTVIQSTALGKPGGSMETIRELMDVKFVHKVDSSPATPSRKPPKSTMPKKPAIPKKIRPKPPASPMRPV
jgi:hypothetical protein